MYEREEEQEFLYPQALAQLFKEVERLKFPSSPVEALEPKVLAVERSEVDRDLTIAGVDGSHIGKELTGHYFGIVTALSYTSPPFQLVDENPLCKPGIFRLASLMGGTWLSLMDAHFVFDTALMTTRLRSPDYILIDGPLLLHPTYLKPLARRASGRDVDRDVTYDDCLKSCIKSVLTLMQHCLTHDIKLIGVVKRPRSMLISEWRRDSAILDRLMEYGQMTESLSPGDHPALDAYSGEMNADLTIKDPSEPGFMRVVYLKSSKVKAPIRVEIPYWVKDESEVANLILQISDPISGVPAHILRAESLIRMGEKTLRSIYLRVLSRELVRDKKADAELKPMYGEEFKAR